MKNKYLAVCKRIIEKNRDFNETKIEEIMYGLEAIYILVTKAIVIFSISYIFGILKEVLYLTFFFSLLRNVGFGLHASKGSICLLVSTILFIGFAILSSIIEININILIIIELFCLICLYMYAPADTEKRPIINSKKRIILKILSILFGICFILLTIFIDNSLIKNIIFFAMILETLMILPISYKLFNQKYNNYKNFKGGEYYE